jgi:hypothetical protein
LENYGEAFHLAPDPYSPDIFIIKHNALPSIDACHADLKALYPKFPEADHLAGEIAAQQTGAESARLWARFESSETAADRLDLLAQLLELDKQNAEKIRALVASERR